MFMENELNKMHEIKDKVEFIQERLSQFIFSLKTIGALVSEEIKGEEHMRPLIDHCYRRILKYLDELDVSLNRNLRVMISQDEIDILREKYVKKEKIG